MTITLKIFASCAAQTYITYILIIICSQNKTDEFPQDDHGKMGQFINDQSAITLSLFDKYLNNFCFKQKINILMPDNYHQIFPNN